MAWLRNIFAGIWAKLAIAGAVVLGLLAAIGIIRKGGKDAERAAQLKRTAETQKRISDADAAGPRTPDAVDDRLRDGKF